MTDGPTTDALLQMAREMGKVAGQTELINGRVGEIGDAVRDLAETNAVDHRRTDVQLAEINLRLAAGDKRFDGLERRVDTLERKPRNGNGTKWGEVFSLAKTYGPYIFAALIAFWAYFTGQPPAKGGPAP